MRLLRSLAVALALVMFPLGAAGAEPPFGTWTVIGIGGDPVTGEAPTLNIDGDRFGGDGGCNVYGGGVTVDGNAITFTAAASTMMFCIVPGLMEQERLLLDTYALVRSWTAAGNELHLLDANGVPVIVLLATAEIAIRVRGTAEAETTTANYVCGETPITVEYINAGPTALAVLHFPAETIVAANVIAASGARYAGGRYIWWSRGDTADLYDLMAGGEDVPIPCTPVPVPAIR